MALKNKSKVYLSFTKELLDFIDAEAMESDITRTKWINNLVAKEYNKKKKERINSVLEGKNITDDL